jgi:multidrug efflux system membrane fusion protein
MHVDTLEGALIVPTPAVQRGAPGTFVYRVNDERHGVGAAGEARPRRRREDASRGGLKAGDRVVDRRDRQAARRRRIEPSTATRPPPQRPPLRPRRRGR